MINSHKYKIFWALVLLALTPWFYMQCRLTLNTDIAILTAFAERLLAGYKMSEAYYDTNPPLSVIIQIPAVLITKISGWSYHVTTLIWSFFLLGLSMFLTSRLLGRFRAIERPLYHLLLALFLFANTLATVLFFGEKDQYLLLALVPFVLTQLCLTFRIDLPPWLKWTALIFGSSFILIKPHYGLIPTLILIDRAVRQRRFWSIALDNDFIALAAGVLTYLLIIFAFFGDFVTVILPDVFVFYAGDYHPKVWPVSLFLGMVVFSVGAMITTLDNVKRHHKTIVVLLGGLCLLCLIPYLVQMKGLYYQKLPAICFMSVMLGAAAYAVLNQKLPPFQTMALTTAGALATFYYIFQMPLHTDFREKPVSRIIEQHCPSPCSYLFINNTNDLIWQIEAYHDARHASRFSSMWFLPELVDETVARQVLWERAMFTDEEFEHYKTKYANFVAEDFRRFKPDLVMVVKRVTFAPYFEIGDFFSYSPAFRDVWKNYKFIGEESYNRRVYYPNSTLDYDYEVTLRLYKRISSQPNNPEGQSGRNTK